MSKRRQSERGSGETSGRASRQCPGISGNNAKRAGPFILGKNLVFLFFQKNRCCEEMVVKSDERKVGVCVHALEKNVKNFSGPHDINQISQNLCVSGMLLPSSVKCILTSLL